MGMSYQLSVALGPPDSFSPEGWMPGGMIRTDLDRMDEGLASQDVWSCCIGMRSSARRYDDQQQVFKSSQQSGVMFSESH